MKRMLLGALIVVSSFLAVHAQAQDEDAVATAAKAKVSEKLKDPESAKFRDLIHVLPGGEVKTDLVCGWVNAKNSFGGYTGFKKFVVFGKTAMIRDDDPSAVMNGLFDTVWGQCAPAEKADR